VPAPVVVGDYLLLASDEGIATCFEAETGRVAWTARMGNHFSASPIAANGLVYYFPDNGEVKVVRPGEKLDIVATNALGQSCFASPAVSGGRIYVRGERDLFCIGPKFDAPSKGTGP
jgi:outer membrane protein assembly factor BamB